VKVYLRTYGCRANQYDTEVVRSMLRSTNAVEVAHPDEADFAVFNSCTVTSAAEADLRADVRRAHMVNPRIRSVVMGCASAVPDRDETHTPLRTLPGVGATIAGADIDAIAAALGVNADVRPHTQTDARGLLRIQDGCDEHCTFCATTISRGANRSRSIEELIREASVLAEVHPEIVLTGIHIGTYGRDIGSSLGQLVERLITAVPVVRFRLSSVEATEVDATLSELMIHEPRRLAPHLHAPLQSGSDRVLKRMGRHWYTAASYSERIEDLAARVEPFALSADVIVGFSGETDADHAATVALIESLPFTSLHVFPYSQRPGTAATRLGSPVAGAVIKERSAELRSLAAQKAKAHEAGRNGGNCDVVVIERGKGLTEDYLSVRIPDSTISRRERFDGVLSHHDGILTAARVQAA
jgi:threonylcarbamoyladenosine tRNA methylthiotransferase MtaB